MKLALIIITQRAYICTQSAMAVIYKVRTYTDEM